jgi:hypothetical protein
VAVAGGAAAVVGGYKAVGVLVGHAGYHALAPRLEGICGLYCELCQFGGLHYE